MNNLLNKRLINVITLLIVCLNGMGQTKFKINPDLAFGGSFSEYFSDIEYIPLETSKESLIGSIRSMIVTDSSLVVTDRDTKSVCFFSLSGKFLNRIKGSEKAPVSVFKDPFTARLIVAKNNGRQLEYYTLSGKLLEEARIPLHLARLYSGVVLGDNYVLVPNTCGRNVVQNVAPSDSNFFAFEVYNNATPYKSLLPINKNVFNFNCEVVGNNFISDVLPDGSVFAATPIDHIVYKLNRDTSIQMFQLVFPASRVLPKQRLIEAKDKDTRDSIKQRALQNGNIIWGLENLYVSKDLLFFKIATSQYYTFQGSESKYSTNFIYNFKTGKLSSMERMILDDKSYFLPVLDRLVPTNGMKFFNGYCYTEMSSIQMFSSYEKNKARNAQYPASLKKYFTTQNRKSNPVIVKMKLHN